MANTGRKIYTTLKEIYTDDNTPTGNTKLNTPGDPDYIPPTYDYVMCPLPSTTTTTTTTSGGLVCGMGPRSRTVLAGLGNAIQECYDVGTTPGQVNLDYNITTLSPGETVNIGLQYNGITVDSATGLTQGANGTLSFYYDNSAGSQVCVLFQVFTTTSTTTTTTTKPPPY